MMYWWTWFLAIFGGTLLGVVAMLLVEAAEMRDDLRASADELEMLWQLAQELKAKQDQLVAVARHPSTGDLGEKIIEILGKPSR